MYITVRSQEELDRVPLDTEDIIRIEFGTPDSPAVVRNRYKYSVVAWDNSSVEACGNSSVVAYNSSRVEAYNSSRVEAHDSSSVVAYDSSCVVAWNSSCVEAWNSSCLAAWGNSRVVAYNSSRVEAWGNSSVEACGNVQVVDFLVNGTIQISGNARTVRLPQTLDEFLGFYVIEHDETTAVFYKAVHKKATEYVSNYDTGFKYIIGEKASVSDFDDNVDHECGKGIHVSHKHWALNFGRDWSDMAVLEVKVKIKDILLPKNSNGKVRAREVEVIREVPLEECGVLGEIIARQRENRKE